MKLFIFEIIFIFLSTCVTMAQDGRKTENKLMPSQFKIQYAGSMGLISEGVGWNYGKKDNWETDFIIGYIPKYTTDNAKVCITVKESFIPWKVPLKNNNFCFEPLTSSVYFTTVFGEEFWAKEPNKYPQAYYGFSTKIRFNISVGQRIVYKNTARMKMKIKSISAFYEISSNDLYIISAVSNSNLTPIDYLHLSLGMGFRWN